ncbi:hypothetical protein WK61_01235 [Burkholderia ubonensis]|nr:hypothetical protein WK61_01235 [Burkholderia ubonensis]
MRVGEYLPPESRSAGDAISQFEREWLPNRRGYEKGRDDAMNGDWGPFAVAFLVACALGGLVMVLVGLFGSDRTAGSWADATSSDEAALIVMVVAIPLHFVLLRFYERR